MDKVMVDPMFDGLMATEEGRRAYYSEGLIFHVTEQLCVLMKNKSINRKQLADLLGVTKGHITQLLSGQHNMTLETASDLFYVLGCELNLGVTPIKVEQFVDAGTCCTEPEMVVQSKEDVPPPAPHGYQYAEAA